MCFFNFLMSYPEHYKDLNTLRKQYGSYLFEKDHEGFHVCFFEDCLNHMKANFQRHINKHEDEGDRVDEAFCEMRTEYGPNQSPRGRSKPNNNKSSSNLLMCSYRMHEEVCPNLPRSQPETNFFGNSRKCKTCYVHWTAERIKQAKSSWVPRDVRRGGGGGATTGGSGRLNKSFSKLDFAAALDNMPHATQQPESNEYEFEPVVRPQLNEDMESELKRLKMDPVREKVMGLDYVIGQEEEPKFGLRHAAVAAAWRKAILNELKELGKFTCKEELEELEQEMGDDGGSLQKLQDNIETAMIKAANRVPGEDGAFVAKMFLHSINRIREARQAVRNVESSSNCGLCAKEEDPSPGCGAPVLCVGICNRVFHASCAGNPDDSYTCEQCQNGVPVVRNVDHDCFIYTKKELLEPPAPGFKWDARGPFWTLDTDSSKTLTIGDIMKHSRVRHNIE